MAQPRRPKNVSGPAQSAAFSGATTHADPTKMDLLSGFLKGSYVEAPPEGTAAPGESVDKGIQAANNIAMYLKNLTKPSEVTKLKALNETIAAIKTPCPDELLAPYVINIIDRYGEHVYHGVTNVRLLMNRVLLSAIETKGKAVRQALSQDAERLIGPWMCSTQDSDRAVRQTALQAWETAFTEEKRPQVLTRLLKPLVAHLEDNVAMVTKPIKGDSSDKLTERTRMTLLVIRHLLSTVVEAQPLLQPLVVKSMKKFFPGKPGFLLVDSPSARAASFLLLATAVGVLPLAGDLQSICIPAAAAVGLEDDSAVVEEAWGFLLRWMKSSGGQAKKIFSADDREDGGALNTLLAKFESPDGVVLETVCHSALPFFAMYTKDMDTVEPILKAAEALVARVERHLTQGTRCPICVWEALADLWELAVIRQQDNYPTTPSLPQSIVHLFDTLINSLQCLSGPGSNNGTLTLATKLKRLVDKYTASFGKQLQLDCVEAAGKVLLTAQEGKGIGERTFVSFVQNTFALLNLEDSEENKATIAECLRVIQRQANGDRAIRSIISSRGTLHSSVFAAKAALAESSPSSTASSEPPSASTAVPVAVPAATAVASIGGVEMMEKKKNAFFTRLMNIAQEALGEGFAAELHTAAFGEESLQSFLLLLDSVTLHGDGEEGEEFVSRVLEPLSEKILSSGGAANLPPALLDKYLVVIKHLLNHCEDQSLTRDSPIVAALEQFLVSVCEKESKQQVSKKKKKKTKNAADDEEGQQNQSPLVVMVEAAVPLMRGKFKYSNLFEALATYFQSFLTTYEDEVEEEDGEEEEEEEKDEDEESADQDEESDEEEDGDDLAPKLRHADADLVIRDVKAWLTVFETLLDNAEGGAAETTGKLYSTKSMKLLLRSLFDLLLIVSPQPKADAYCSDNLVKLISSGDYEDPEDEEPEGATSSSEGSDEEGEEEEDEDITAEAYLALWKPRHTVRLDSYIDALQGYHSLLDLVGDPIRKSMVQELCTNLEQTILGDPDSSICVVSHTVFLATVIEFQHNPTFLMNPSNWKVPSLGIDHSLMIEASSTTGSANASEFTPTAINIAAALCGAQGSLALAELATHDFKSFSTSPAGQFLELLQKLTQLRFAAGSVVAAKVVTAVDELVALLVAPSASSSSTLLSLETLVHLAMGAVYQYSPTNESSVTSTPFEQCGPVHVLSTVCSLSAAVATQPAARDLVQGLIASFTCPKRTQTTYNDTTSTLVVACIRRLESVGVDVKLQHHGKKEGAGRPSLLYIPPDNLFSLASRMESSANLHFLRAALVIVQATDAQLPLNLVEKVLQLSRKAANVEGLALVAALLNCLLEDHSDVCRAAVDLLSKNIALSHLPTNGRLGQRVPGSVPIPLRDLRKILLEVLELQRAMKRYRIMNDTLMSTTNLLLFDSVCTCVLSIEGIDASNKAIQDAVRTSAIITPFFEEVQPIEIKSLRASTASVTVLSKVLLRLHSFIGSCPAAKMERLNSEDVLRLTSCVCLMTIVALVGADVECPDELRTILEHPPVGALRRIANNEGTVRIAALRKVYGSFKTSLKQQVSLLTYLAGSAAAVSLEHRPTTENTVEGENAATSAASATFKMVQPFLNLVLTLSLTPSSGKKGSIGLQGSWLTAPQAPQTSLGFDLQVLGRVAHTGDLLRHLSLGALSVFPLVIQGPFSSYFTRWRNHVLEKGLAEGIASFVTTHISPVMIQSSFAEILAHSGGELSFSYSDETSITIDPANRVVLVEFSVDESTGSVRIIVPPEFPLKCPHVSNCTAAQSGLSTTAYRQWLLKMLSGGADGTTLWEWVQLYCDNLAKRFEGVEPCPICYSVFSSTDRKLPTLTCSVCKNTKFHASCLYHWWRNSGQTTCPTCRTPWYSS